MPDIVLVDHPCCYLGMPGCAGIRTAEGGESCPSPSNRCTNNNPPTPSYQSVSQGARATVDTPGQVHDMLARQYPLSTHLLRALGRLLGGINGSLVPQFPAALDTEAPAGA